MRRGSRAVAVRLARQDRGLVRVAQAERLMVESERALPPGLAHYALELARVGQGLAHIALGQECIGRGQGCGG